jgi:hypothetical protein
VCWLHKFGRNDQIEPVHCCKDAPPLRVGGQSRGLGVQYCRLVWPLCCR